MGLKRTWSKLASKLAITRLIVIKCVFIKDCLSHNLVQFFNSLYLCSGFINSHFPPMYLVSSLPPHIILTH